MGVMMSTEVFLGALVLLIAGVGGAMLLALHIQARSTLRMMAGLGYEQPREETLAESLPVDLNGVPLGGAEHLHGRLTQAESEKFYENLERQIMEKEDIQ